MLRHAAWLVLIASFGVPPLASSASPDGPRFDVVSIKANTSGSGGQRMNGQGERWEIVNMPILTLVQVAYPTRVSQILGAPEWVKSEPYDIVAIANGVPDSEQRRLMARALLADRFKLVVRQESQDRPVYRLVLDREDRQLGPNLHRSTSNCSPTAVKPSVTLPNGAPRCGMSFSEGSMSGGGVPISTLAGMLSVGSERVVLDGTGLAGNYEFTLRYSDTDAAGGAAPLDTRAISTAIREQLGLRLVAEEAPLDVLVIESIQRPTPDSAFDSTAINRPSKAAVNPAVSRLGVVRDGRYHHNQTRTEFPVPEGWSVLSTGPSSGGGEQMYLQNAAAPQVAVAVWMKQVVQGPIEVDKQLQAAPSLKAQQRTGEGAEQFRFRPDTVVRTIISNHSAVNGLADFVQGPVPAVEYFTWIYTGETHVLFRVRGTPSEAARVREQLESIIQLADIP